MISILLPFVLAAATAVPTPSPAPRDAALEAWKKGDIPRAARLFGEAADAETNPAARAELRVRQAWAYFILKERDHAEDALLAAVHDRPQLELSRDYYTDDFIALFAAAKKKAEPPPSPTPPPVATSAGPAPAALDDYRRQLAQAVDSATIDALVTQLQQMESQVPPAQLPDLLELKADALERLGRASDALEQRGRVAALRALASAPPGGKGWPLDTLLEARRLLGNNLATEAAALMRGVLREIPSCSPALELLGEALLASGRLDEAYGALQTALAANETPDLLLALGEVELRRGRTANARDLFRRVAESDPGNDRAWAALGLTAARLQDFGTARDALDRAIQANGTLFSALVVRAELALAAGDPGSAVQLLQRALQVKPDDPWASGWLGFAYLAAGNLQTAESGLERGWKALPEQFSLPYAELLRRTDRAEKALSVLGDSDDDASRLLRARCLLDLGKFDEAAAVLRTVRAQRPEDGRAAYLLGVALADAGDWNASAAALAEAVTLKGSPPSANESLANVKATAVAKALMDGALAVPRPQPPH